MRLTRSDILRAPISLVPMIDVLMILLVFFMVTSTYLDLDMVPMAGGAEEPTSAGSAQGGGVPLLIRLDAEGVAHLRGLRLSPAALARTVSRELAAAPGREVVVLPSGAADVQALVRVMDAAVAGGAGRLRVVRLEGR